MYIEIMGARVRAHRGAGACVGAREARIVLKATRKP